jgi:hypothetical protein
VASSHAKGKRGREAGVIFLGFRAGFGGKEVLVSQTALGKRKEF